jgi:hypothetical protein
MAYFGRKVKKPLSKPGAGSGGVEQDVQARLNGLERRLARGRQARPVRAAVSARAERRAR